MRSFPYKAHPRRASFIVLILFFILGSNLPFTAADDIFIQLDDEGFDMELDMVRQRIYVSVPDQNEIAIISMQSLEVTNRLDLSALAPSSTTPAADGIVVGTRPMGIDLSLDGSRLFVALNGASSVVYVDLDTLELTQVVIGSELGSALTYDVVEGKPNRVFASANPGSGGFSYVTLIKLDEGDSAVRVAGDRIIRARPTFARSPDAQFLYVGEGFSPNSLYKLDLSTDTAPIVLEDEHGSVSGTDHLQVAPDSTRIYLGSGQVLQTDDFIQIGVVGSGVPRLNADGTRAYVTKEPGTVEIYETAFFQMVDTIDLPCSFNDIKAVELLDDGNGFLVLGDDKVCGIGNVDIPSFTCNLSLSFSDQTLRLDFDLGSSEPAAWNLILAYFNTTASLWRVPLPIVTPPVSFEVPLSGFPSVGKIGFLTTLVTAEGIVCSDWEVIDTGSELGEAANESLRQLLMRLQRNP